MKLTIQNIEENIARGSKTSEHVKVKQNPTCKPKTTAEKMREKKEQLFDMNYSLRNSIQVFEYYLLRCNT